MVHLIAEPDLRLIAAACRRVTAPGDRSAPVNRWVRGPDSTVIAESRAFRFIRRVPPQAMFRAPDGVKPD